MRAIILLFILFPCINGFFMKNSKNTRIILFEKQESHDKTNPSKCDNKNDKCCNDNVLANNKTIEFTKKTRFVSGSTGHDYRYCNNKNVDDIEKENRETFEKLAKFNYQMKLLNSLQNNEISQFDKLKRIEEYNFLFEKNKYLSNINAGDLIETWENTDI